VAVTGRGSGCVTVITLPNEPSLRAGLDDHLRQVTACSPEILEGLRGASPDGKPTARSATAALAAHLDHPGLIATGDSSIAADPLCGHGMYEALRSAAVAAAAANSFLSTGDWRPVSQFVTERAGEIWRRSCEAAAFHYGRQAVAIPTLFWSRASAAYESGLRKQTGEVPGPSSTAAPVRIEPRPVLNGSRIELRRVVISPRMPRGVWKVDGVDLVALLDVIRQAPNADLVRAAALLSCEPAKAARAARWLSDQGMLSITGWAACIRESSLGL
jgi:hypothetical protein